MITCISQSKTFPIWIFFSYFFRPKKVAQKSGNRLTNLIFSYPTYQRLSGRKNQISLQPLDPQPHILNIHWIISIKPLDPSKEKIMETTNNLNISYPISQKAYQLIEKYNIRSYPYLLISDSDGKIVYFQTGYRNGDELYLDKFIEELLSIK